MANQNKENFFMQDLAIITMSIVFAVFLVETSILSKILLSTLRLELFGSFVAGLFFTSIFTTAPAIVTLGQIAHSSGSVWSTALFGALGAVVGDLFIFKFVRDRLSEHFLELIKHEGYWKRVKALLRLKYFRWITFLLGGLIIASPFPDELGIGLLGFSKMKVKTFIPISFIFNFIGIVIIGFVAQNF